MDNRMTFREKSKPIYNRGVFLMFLALTFLCFFKGFRGELVDDGLAGLVKFQNMGLQGFWSSFGFTSLYYCHDAFVLAIYKLVGKSALGWFIVMATLHSLNAVVAFAFFKRFYSVMEVSHGTIIAFAGSLLFLLSPYQTENVLWAATLHYSIALVIFLFSCITVLKSLQSGQLKGKTIVMLGALYLVSLMTLEISLIFPFAYFLIGLIIILSKKTTITIRQFLIRFILPLLSLIVLYFVATRIIKGHWLPHYGEVHLLNNDVKTYCTNYARYVIKTLGYVHFTSFRTRDLIYGFCGKWQLMFIAGAAICISIYFLFRRIKGVATANAFLGLMVFSFIMLLPSLHMFFMYLFTPVNDRLGYFFSLAIYQLLSLVLIGFFSSFGMGLTFAFAMVGIYFLYKETGNWQTAGAIQDNCVNSFVWQDAPKVYILSAPTYFNGVYIFRNNERIPYAMDFYCRTKHPERITSIISFCSMDITDSTVVTVKNDSTLQVSINTCGWLMNDGNGAEEYGTNEFTVKPDKWKPVYEVVFHNKQPGAVYIAYSYSGFHRIKDF